MFEVRGSILRGVNGNVSFTVTIFVFKHSPYFFYHTTRRNNLTARGYDGFDMQLT